MIDHIFGPFQYGFMVRALIVSVLVGVMCPILGAYVITRGRAFMGDALAHSVLPGMVVAFLLGISPFFAAVPAGIVIALLMGAVSRRTGISEDTSIGIVFAGMFALGLVMLSTAENVTVDIEDLLLGQVLGVSQTDVFVSLGLTALVLAGLYAFHRQLVYTTFDPVGAEVVGIRTSLVEYVLLALLALVIVIGIQAAGIVLVMAMLITPSAAGYLLARRFVGVMLIGALIGAASAVAGLYLSFHADLPSGPAMALVATVCLSGWRPSSGAAGRSRLGCLVDLACGRAARAARGGSPRTKVAPNSGARFLTGPRSFHIIVLTVSPMRELIA